jgi:hypothetical protein
MNWWSASNWCQANGSSLMTLATLNTLSGGDSAAARVTALTSGLKLTSAYVWLEDTNGSSSCEVRQVGLGNGGLGGIVRRMNFGYALCR